MLGRASNIQEMPLLDPLAADWQNLLRQHLCGYRHLPDPLREQLHERMRQFLESVTFETPDRITLTDEMKIIIAGHACLLLLGNIGDYASLKTIHVYRRKFRLHNYSWDSYHEGPDLHMAWDYIQEELDSPTDWNELLYRFSEVTHAQVGLRGQEQAFEQWLNRYKESPESMKSMEILSSGHALKMYTPSFFETPKSLKVDDPEMYDLLRKFFQTDPIDWQSSRRASVSSRPVPDHWTEWLGRIRFYHELSAEQQARLHQRIHVLLDEIDWLGDQQLKVTEEMQVTIAGQAGMLLLGPHHESFSQLATVLLCEGTSSKPYDWEQKQLTFYWGNIQVDLAEKTNSMNCMLGVFVCFLDNPDPLENIPILKDVFTDYKARKRNRKLHSWELETVETEFGRFCIYLGQFIENPFNLHRDLPELYEAFRDYFALDPMEMTRLEMEKRRVPFQPHWKKIMRDKIGLYQKLPRAKQAILEKLMPDFLGQVQFIPQGLPEITEEMKVTIAAEACILILGRGIEDYRDLETVEVWKGNPDGKRDTVGDATFNRVRLNWAETSNSAFDANDNYNIVLHEFAHVIDNADDFKADSIPLPANAAERHQWEELIRREQMAIRRSRFGNDKHLIPEYGATKKAEFFTCATESFFEKPAELKRDHTEIYEAMKGFYQLDPANWPGND